MSIIKNDPSCKRIQRVVPSRGSWLCVKPSGEEAGGVTVPVAAQLGAHAVLGLAL